MHPATRARRSLGAPLSNAACANGDVVPTSANLATVRAATLCLINRERAAAGAGPLHLNEALQRSADEHTESMEASEYFEHSSPGGGTMLDRVRAAGYISSGAMNYEIGENIAYGSFEEATPTVIVAAWMASQGHRENILNAEFRDTGIGIAPQLPNTLAGGEEGAMYTEDFGVVL